LSGEKYIAPLGSRINSSSLTQSINIDSVTLNPHHPTNIDFSAFDVAFCDSLSALRQAQNDGLSANALIVTSAPEVYFSKHNRVASLFGKKDRGHLFAFMEAGGDLTREVFLQISRKSDLAEYALVVARTVHKVHQSLTKISALAPEDFQEPRLVISVDTGNKRVNEFLNPPIEQFLSQNGNVKEIVYPVANVRAQWHKEPILYRLPISISGFAENFLWKVGKLRSLVRYFDNRPRLMFVLGGHLVREAAAKMMFSGYAVDHVAKTAKDFNDICGEGLHESPPAGLLNAIEQHIEYEVRAVFSRWIHPSAHRPSWDLLRALLSNELGRFCGARASWRHELSKRKPKAVFLGPPMRPEMLGMIAACRESGIPTISGQHGVSREIEDTFDRCRSVFYENSAVDLLLCYNRRSVIQSESSVFKMGASSAVGMSKDYYRTQRSAPQSRKHPILYVSTALLSGSVNMLKGGFTDIQRVRMELNIVDNVLGKIPYGVVYKSYHFGTARYAETGIVERQAARHQNIRVFDEPVELADFFPTRYRLIITSRATSTMAWCLMARKPLILIDIPEDSPLKADVKAKLADSIFLFSAADPNLYDKLAGFCARGFDKIDKEWQEKESSRRGFIENYVEGSGKDAGNQAAASVVQLLNRKVRSSTSICVDR
jgi:hypothetical protein